MTRLRCAILDDYFQAFAGLRGLFVQGHVDRVDLTVFDKPFETEAEAAAALKAISRSSSPCGLRTAFPKSMFAALPNLKLMITSGMRNAAIDFEAAKAHNVVLCGTVFALVIPPRTAGHGSDPRIDAEYRP